MGLIGEISGIAFGVLSFLLLYQGHNYNELKIRCKHDLEELINLRESRDAEIATLKDRVHVLSEQILSGTITVESMKEDAQKRLQFLSRIVSAVPIGFITADADRSGNPVITWINPFGAQLLGYTPEELVNQSLSIIISSDEQKDQRAAFSRAAATGTFRRESFLANALTKNKKLLIVRHQVGSWEDMEGRHFVACIMLI